MDGKKISGHVAIFSAKAIPSGLQNHSPSLILLLRISIDLMIILMIFVILKFYIPRICHFVGVTRNTFYMVPVNGATTPVPTRSSSRWTRR